MEKEFSLVLSCITNEDWLSLSEDKRNAILYWLKIKNRDTAVLTSNGDILYVKPKDIVNTINTISAIPVINVMLILSYIQQEGSIKINKISKDNKLIAILTDRCNSSIEICLDDNDSLYKLFDIMLSILDTKILARRRFVKNRAIGILLNKTAVNLKIKGVETLRGSYREVVEKEISCIENCDLKDYKFPLEIFIRGNAIHIFCRHCGNSYVVNLI